MANIAYTLTVNWVSNAAASMWPRSYTAKTDIDTTEADIKTHFKQLILMAYNYSYESTLTLEDFDVDFSDLDKELIPNLALIADSDNPLEGFSFERKLINRIQSGTAKIADSNFMLGVSVTTIDNFIESGTDGFGLTGNNLGGDTDVGELTPTPSPIPKLGL